MSDLTRRLRALNDGVSRPVSILEREVCGIAADEIERLRGVAQAPGSPSPAHQKEPGGDWYIRNGDGSEHRLLDLAPNLEREALKDPAHVAARAQAPSGVREALERIAAFNIRPSTGTSVAMLMRDIAKDALSSVSSTDRAAPPSVALDATAIQEIETCAKLCDAHARWAEEQIEDDPESKRSQLFALISNTANDCAAMIRDRLPGGAVAGTERGGQGK